MVIISETGEGKSEVTKKFYNDAVASKNLGPKPKGRKRQRYILDIIDSFPGLQIGVLGSPRIT